MTWRVHMPAVVFRSMPVSNCPDTCDTLHLTNLALDVVSITAVHANTSIKVLLNASYLFSDALLYIVMHRLLAIYCISACLPHFYNIDN